MQQERKDVYVGFEEDVKSLYGNDIKLYGPYVRNLDGRTYVVIKRNGKKGSKMLAKVLLEIKEGRLLTKEETADHIDGNFLNDTFENLQILSRSKNAAKSVRRRVREEIMCAGCGAGFIPSGPQVQAEHKKYAGPFCGRVCTGRYGAMVRFSGQTMQRNPVFLRYYTEDQVVQ